MIFTCVVFNYVSAISLNGYTSTINDDDEDLINLISFLLLT